MLCSAQEEQIKINNYKFRVAAKILDNEWDTINTPFRFENGARLKKHKQSNLTFLNISSLNISILINGNSIVTNTIIEVANTTQCVANAILANQM